MPVNNNIILVTCEYWRFVMNIVFILFLIIITIIFFLGIRRALVISETSVHLINKYEHDKNNSNLIDEIFSFITKDFLLNRVVRENFATKKDIEILHSKLMEWGDFRKYNRYIPITSFFNLTTLDYLLKHKNEDAQSLTKKMMNHFHI